MGIEVPPTAFFIAAPILTAAVYCYLHVYLLGLWEALGRIEQPQPRTSQPLSDRVFPMLFTVAALWYRNRIRGDESFRERALGRWTLAIAILMGWGFGWAILFLLWWRSMPLHHEGLTLLIGLSFWITLFFGVHGLWAAHSYLRDPDYQHIRHFSWREAVLTTLVLFVVSAVAWLRTEGGLEEYMEDPWFTSEDTAKIIPLYPANLAEAELTRKPADWLDYEDWKKEYTLKFRKRYDLEPEPKKWPEHRRTELAEEIPERWSALTRSLDKISLRGADLRESNLESAFLVGADLREARLERADLTAARLEGASLRNGMIERAYFGFANLEGADLSFTAGRGAFFTAANLASVNLRSAFMPMASFSKVRNLTQDAVDSAFGDDDTELPAEIVAPCHWPAMTLSTHDRDPAYQIWLEGWSIPVPRKPDGTCPDDL